MRPQDNIARIDVRNFAIIFPNAEVEEAKNIMLNLQRELTKSIFLHNKKEKILITFSAGITAMKMANSDEEDDDDDRRDQQEQIALVAEAAVEEIGQGDGVADVGVAADALGHDQPV